MRIPYGLVGPVSDLLREYERSLPDAESISTPVSIGALPEPGQVSVIGPATALDVLNTMADQKIGAAVVMLDPWYRSKNGAGRSAYLTEVLPLIQAAARVGDHVFIWGFPEHVARLVDLWPDSLKFGGWITWWFKNAPSRGKGWRPSQQACLHLHRRGAKFYPENFYSERHKSYAAENRLEYKTTPYTVIESGLLSGFIKKSEQRGLSGQKPESVIEPLLRMTTRPGDLVIDPTCGTGTTAAVAVRFDCSAIISDRDIKSLKKSRARLLAAST